MECGGHPHEYFELGHSMSLEGIEWVDGGGHMRLRGSKVIKGGGALIFNYLEHLQTNTLNTLCCLASLTVV